MTAPDVILAAAVAVPVALMLAWLWVSMLRRYPISYPIPWGAMWRALTRRARGQK